jgi:hypothetical protein
VWHVDEVVQERVSDNELILIKGTKVVSSASIILRGANDYMFGEMERSLHDALSVVKRTLESGTVVPGGGAVESVLSIYLNSFATTLVRALRVCRRAVRGPQDARRQRRARRDGARRVPARVPPRRAGRARGRPQEGAAALRARPAAGRGRC